jgi:hypothetical protein
MPKRSGEPEETLPESLPNSAQAEAVLLVNPPVVDTRLPWARWQQPGLLYRYGSYLRGRGATVRMIDALAVPRAGRLRKEKVQQFVLDGQRVDQWRFGRARKDVAAEMRSLAESGWYPQVVVVEGFTTFWWRGVREMVELVREIFPETRVQVVGAYAALAPAHVEHETGAIPVPQLPAEVAACPTDWSLGHARPPIAYLSTANGTRSAGAVIDEIDEIASGAERGVTLFAFAEHGVVGRHPELFSAILEGVLQRSLKAHFVATGTLSPAEFVANPTFPALMRRAGFRQLFFADDRHVAPGAGADDFLESCHEVAALCQAAGFRGRTDELGGAVSLGRLGDDLGERARMITRVSHALGSVVLWPYQPAPSECPGVDLELANGKLFPLRARNGATYRDYLNVQGIAVVMNAKYRENTFNFLGESLVARMFRDSLAREAWSPDPAVKGGLRLPAPLKRGAA